MEFLIEALADLFLEGSLEISKNKKISKWIRYPLIMFIIALYLALFGLMLFVGINLLDENMIVGLMLIIITLGLLLYCVLKFKEIYLNKKAE